MNLSINASLLALGMLLASQAALAQTPAAVEPVTAPDTAAENANDLCAEPDPQDDGDPSAVKTDQRCLEPPAQEGLGVGVDQGEMRASMRRFVPSEQISEDSSVAFPNDI